MARRDPMCVLFVERSRVFPDMVSLRAETETGRKSASEARAALTRAGFKPGDRVIVRLAPAPTEPKP